MAKIANNKKKATSEKKVLPKEEKKIAVKSASSKVSTKKIKKRIDSEQPTKVEKEEIKKISLKKEPAKLTTKEPLKRVTTKTVEKIAVNPEPKKVTTKVLKKLTVTEEPKKVVKKNTTPKVDEKKAYYDAMSLEDCIMNMKKMNVQYHYEDYAQLLSDEDNITQLISNIKEGNRLYDLDLDYKVDGYDIDLVKVTLHKVKDTMDLTVNDFKKLKKEVEASVTFELSSKEELNAEEYLKEFHLCERIMLLGKRKHISQLEDMDKFLNINTSEFTKHFMDLAYTILPTWKYEDVIFYEDFMYAYVSSFSDLYVLYEQRVQLDCADLYIRHGDRNRGNAGYDYLLRDNQIKDYIYYRFAHVYEGIDDEMAKSIAQSALEWVDDRFVYYPNIMQIIQK